MVESYLRQSALAHLGLVGHPGPGDELAGVTLGERPFPGIVNLRVARNDSAARSAVAEALGTDLPASPNTVAPGEDIAVLWLGPDEWWIVTTNEDPEGGPRLAAQLNTALAGHHTAVTDVSESRACITVRGPRARAVLQKGCPLDFHARVFTAGHCAQSLLAKVDATFHLVADETAGAGTDPLPVFHVYVPRSCADYAWHWLLDAGREYGVAISAG